MKQKTRNLSLIISGMGVMDMRKIKDVHGVAKYCAVESPEHTASFVTENVMALGEVIIVLTKTPLITKMVNVKKDNYLGRESRFSNGAKRYLYGMILLVNNATEKVREILRLIILSRLPFFHLYDTTLQMD